MAENNTLFQLLNLDPNDKESYQKLDSDAIMREVKQNPHYADSKYRFIGSGGAGQPGFPLHQAIKLKAPLHVIHALCLPISIKEKDDLGNNLLHIALLNATPLDIISLLLQKHPESITEANIRGDTPLHLACLHGASLEVVTFLLREWASLSPNTNPMRLRNRFGHTLLHCACASIRAPLYDIISFLVQQDPDGLKEMDNLGCTALHRSCQYQAPVELVSLLLKGWPGAIRKTSSVGYTPLHCACACRAPLDVVSLLVDEYPGALRRIDNDFGFTPLHCACQVNASLDVVTLLVDGWADALKRKCEELNTPLHLACFGADSSLEVVSFLVGRSGDALREKNVEGCTPLHCACADGASFEVVSLLMDEWQDALTEKSTELNTPLHLACDAAASLDVILVLLDKYPDAVLEKNGADETPFDMAEEDIDSEDTLKLLSYVSNLLDGKATKDSSKDIINYFTGLEWWNGVVLLLDRRPDVVQTINLELGIIPIFLRMAGHCCKITTMWEVLRNKLDLFNDI